MSLWYCADHGFTGPQMCCGAAGHVTVTPHGEEPVPCTITFTYALRGYATDASESPSATGDDATRTRLEVPGGPSANPTSALSDTTSWVFRPASGSSLLETAE